MSFLLSHLFPHFLEWRNCPERICSAKKLHRELDSNNNPADLQALGLLNIIINRDKLMDFETDA